MAIHIKGYDIVSESRVNASFPLHFFSETIFIHIKVLYNKKNEKEVRI